MKIEPRATHPESLEAQQSLELEAAGSSLHKVKNPGLIKKKAHQGPKLESSSFFRNLSPKSLVFINPTRARDPKPEIRDRSSSNYTKAMSIL